VQLELIKGKDDVLPNSEMTSRSKRGTKQPQRDGTLLGGGVAHCSLAVASAPVAGRCITPASSLPVFVDDEFEMNESSKCQQGYTKGCDYEAAGATLASDVLSGVAEGHLTVVQTVGTRLNAMRAFKGRLAFGDVCGALDAVLSSQNCWGRQDIVRFRSLLASAAMGLTQRQPVMAANMRKAVADLEELSVRKWPHS